MRKLKLYAHYLTMNRNKFIKLADSKLSLAASGEGISELEVSVISSVLAFRFSEDALEKSCQQVLG